MRVCERVNLCVYGLYICRFVLHEVDYLGLLRYTERVCVFRVFALCVVYVRSVSSRSQSGSSPLQTPLSRHILSDPPTSR